MNKLQVEVRELAKVTEETMRWNDFVILSVCPHTVPSHARDFRIAQIKGELVTRSHTGKTRRRGILWSYSQKLPRVAAACDYARIAIVDDEPVIGMVRDNALAMTIPVTKLPIIAWYNAWFVNGYWYPGTNLEEVIELKRKVAEKLELKCSWNTTEQFVIRELQHREAKRAKEIADARDAEMRASRAEVEAGVARLQKKFACMSR